MPDLTLLPRTSDLTVHQPRHVYRNFKPYAQKLKQMEKLKQMDLQAEYFWHVLSAVEHKCTNRCSVDDAEADITMAVAAVG